MRAKKVYSQAWIWDFDDTLFTTEAKVYVHDNNTGEFIISLDANEFNKFKKTKDQFLDFSDFVNNEIIIKAKPYKAFHILKSVDDGISSGIINGDLYILTARTPHVQKGIFDVLRLNGIKNIPGNNIICIGDGKGEIDIPKEKKEILKMLNKKYDEIYFYDDSKKNINAADELRINSYLIEEYI